MSKKAFVEQYREVTPSLPFHEIVGRDFKRYLDHRGYRDAEKISWHHKLYVLFTSPGFFAVLIHRIGYFSTHRFSKESRHPMKYIFKIADFLGRTISIFVFKTSIKETLAIGPGLFISNRGGVIVGAKTIGMNCTIQNNVTIGAGGQGMKSPELGDNVRVESGSVVFGGITIGHNVIIRSGAVCSKRIPSNGIVSGNPAKLIRDGCKSIRRVE